jgi:hypothetical protein
MKTSTLHSTFPHNLRTSHFGTAIVSCVIALLMVSTARAQWVTESYSLKPGWNAIWLPLDVSHASIEELAPVQVEEIWRWNAAVAGTFTQTPAGPPSQTQPQWQVWRRLDPGGTTLSGLQGNYAYLVRVDPSATPLTWTITGKPLAPRYDWTSTGVNLVGFPIETPANAATRNLARFFGFDPVLKTLPPTLFYNGGELSDVAPKNPLVIGNQNSFQINRFQAYWVEATSYTEYYGPLKVEVGANGGLNFGSEGVAVAVRLKNVAVNSTNTQSVTVTLTPGASEAPPGGQTAITGTVPLLLRGDLNLTTGVYAYDPVTGPVTQTLAPGQEKELIFTVDRSALGSTADLNYASLLSITDSLNLSRIVLPVSASTATRSGLWVGAAVMNQVSFVEGNTTTTQSAPATFPLRLILHSDTSGNVVFLQQAYIGVQDGQDAVAAEETDFTAPDKPSKRVSTTNFPLGMERPGGGSLGLSGTLTFNTTLSFNASTNPFVHKYHPDHDNLDERFEAQLPSGRESNNVIRSVTLTFLPQNPDGFDPTWGSTTLGGTYSESVTGLRSQPLTTSGVFIIRRTNSAAALLTP